MVVNATRLFNKGVPGHVRPLQKGDRDSHFGTDNVTGARGTIPQLL